MRIMVHSRIFYLTNKIFYGFFPLVFFPIFLRKEVFEHWFFVFMAGLFLFFLFVSFKWSYDVSKMYIVDGCAIFCKNGKEFSYYFSDLEWERDVELEPLFIGGMGFYVKIYHKHVRFIVYVTRSNSKKYLNSILKFGKKKQRKFFSF